MDISLSDILWVGGGMLAVLIGSLLFTRRDEIAQALGASWSLSGGSAWHDSGSGTSAAVAVPQQQHQAASAPVPDFELIISYLQRHNLTDDEAIDLFAVAHRESGDLLSANKIREIVGGNEAAVKARVARYRPKPPQPKPSPRLERPADGWGKAS